MFDDENDEEEITQMSIRMECDTIGEAAGTVVTNFIHQIEQTGVLDEIEVGETIGEVKIGNYRILIVKDNETNTEGLQ